MKRSRVIGTTEDAIRRAEGELDRQFPPSFRQWLLENNGKDIEDVNVYPVLDDRDPRGTWDSIVRNFRGSWAGWLENFEDAEMSFDHLLPFADFGSGDYYCFDYSRISGSGECPVVHWSHETGQSEARAASFNEFEIAVRAGEFESD